MAMQRHSTRHADDDADTLRRRLDELEATLAAIRGGEVDALVVEGAAGEQVYSLQPIDQGYLALVESMGEGAALIDGEGLVTYCNPALGGLLGCEPEALLGLPLAGRADPGEALAATLTTARETGALKREVELRRDDGSRIPVQLTLTCLGAGQPTLCAVFTDLSLRRRTEALLAAERLARAVMEQSGEAILVCDLDGVVLRANAPARRLCEGEPESRPLRQVLRPDGGESAELYRRIAAVMADHEPLHGLETTVRRKAGGPIHLILSATALRGEAGGVMGCILVLTDVSDMVRARKELAASEALFRRLADANLVGVAVGDFSGHIAYANDEMLRMMGYTRADHEAGRVNWVESLAPEHRARTPELVEQLRREQRVVGYERAFVRPDGKKIPIIGAAALIEPGADLHVAVALDLTRLKEAEAALVRKNEELSRMNTELEEFAYVASHDLKAPLRAVANLAYVIDEDSAGGLDEENRRRLRLMRERIKVMDALIEGLLSYARLGRVDRRSGPVGLADLLRELAGSLPLPAGFRIVWEESLPTLTADPRELRQVFQNLITNAVAHHDRPGQAYVRVSARDGGDVWLLAVADDGPGIPGPMRERVFRMFSGSGKAGHSGIGLAVVRKLVVANGGRIEVTDNAPRGALFRIAWPK